MRSPRAPYAGRPASARSAAQALSDSTMLSSLLAGHRQAQAWFNSVSSLLPAALAAQVRAGPLHEAEWTLFANNAAVANKLKHSLPLLLERLRAQGAAIDDIRVKVLAPQDR